MYKLRFVQKIKKEAWERFLELEENFIMLEKNDSSMPNGKRFAPVMGKEPTHTLIWECEFATEQEAMSALAAIEQNDTHSILLEEQTSCMMETYTELYRAIP